LDRDLFEAVQAKLEAHHTTQVEQRSKSMALLTGLIFDDAGNRMCPSHTRKDGMRYRYYVSVAHLQARSTEVGSTGRVPAIEVEALVTNAVAEKMNGEPTTMASSELIKTHVSRVVVKAEAIWIDLKAENGNGPADGDGPALETLKIAWTKPPSKMRREILLPAGEAEIVDRRPIRADARARLINALAEGRRWLAELTSGQGVTTVESIAARERCSVRKVNMTVSLAFLAPDLVKAAIEGRLPRGIGIARLIDLPPEWSRQRKVLGLAAC
jgi:hypothetical protein